MDQLEELFGPSETDEPVGHVEPNEPLEPERSEGTRTPIYYYQGAPPTPATSDISDTSDTSDASDSSGTSDTSDTSYTLTFGTPAQQGRPGAPFGQGRADGTCGPGGPAVLWGPDELGGFAVLWGPEGFGGPAGLGRLAGLPSPGLGGPGEPVGPWGLGVPGGSGGYGESVGPWGLGGPGEPGGSGGPWGLGGPGEPGGSGGPWGLGVPGGSGEPGRPCGLIGPRGAGRPWEPRGLEEAVELGGPGGSGGPGPQISRDFYYAGQPDIYGTSGTSASGTPSPQCTSYAPRGLVWVPGPGTTLSDMCTAASNMHLPRETPLQPQFLLQPTESPYVPQVVGLHCPPEKIVVVSMDRAPIEYVPVNVHRCLVCSQIFDMELQLKAHYQWHFCVDTDEFICEQCGRTFAICRNHVIHELGHRCDLCGNVYPEAWMLNAHLIDHVAVPTLIPYCVCAHRPDGSSDEGDEGGRAQPL